jgi:hypothetical protein
MMRTQSERKKEGKYREEEDVMEMTKVSNDSSVTSDHFN